MCCALESRWKRQKMLASGGGRGIAKMFSLYKLSTACASGWAYIIFGIPQFQEAIYEYSICVPRQLSNRKVKTASCLT